MDSQPISRARLGMRLIVNMIVAPAVLIVAVVGVIWLLGVVGIINVNG